MHHHDGAELEAKFATNLNILLAFRLIGVARIEHDGHGEHGEAYV